MTASLSHRYLRRADLSRWQTLLFLLRRHHDDRDRARDDLRDCPEQRAVTPGRNEMPANTEVRRGGRQSQPEPPCSPGVGLPLPAIFG